MSTDPFAAVAALPGVQVHVDAARKAVDGLYGHRSMRRRSEDIAAESAIRGARASAALDGADWSLEELRRRTDYSGESEGHIVAGALRVSAELPDLRGTWQSSPVRVLARLHMLAAADVLPGDQLGRPRVPGEPGPVPPDEVAARLEALTALLAAPSEAPALVVAAIVHAEILALDPFVWGSPAVARAAERLVLQTRGLDPKGVTVPEVGHLDQGDYEQALAAYSTGTPEGLVTWIAHCAQSVVLGARESIAVCEAIMRGI